MRQSIKPLLKCLQDRRDVFTHADLRVGEAIRLACIDLALLDQGYRCCKSRLERMRLAKLFVKHGAAKKSQF